MGLLIAFLAACDLSEPLADDDLPQNVSGDWEIEISNHSRDSDVVRIDYTLTNIGNEAHTTPSSLFDNFLVLDDVDREFSPHTVVDSSAFRPLNPGFSVDGTAVFLVPTSASGLKFQFRGGAFSRAIQFDLID